MLLVFGDVALNSALSLLDYSPTLFIHSKSTRGVTEPSIMTTALLTMTAREEREGNGDPSQSSCSTLERSHRTAPRLRLLLQTVYQSPRALAVCSRLTVMESAKDMLMRAEGGQIGTLSAKTGSNLTEATGDPMRKLPDKQINQNRLSPVPYSQNLVDDATKGHRSAKYGDVTLASKPSAPDRDLSDIPNKEASSSDAESDLYEEIDVSCTPESMDYPSGQGKKQQKQQKCFITTHSILVLFAFIYSHFLLVFLNSR